MASTLDAVLDDFTESWERGERPRAERYLARLRQEDSAELIYHEYCLAEASDLAPNPADFLRRFPEHADRLGRLFALHGAVPSKALRDWADPAELPVAGDEIGPYRLARELGRGAFARVFLAEQSDLDGRLVVLKVSSRPTAEPQLLARARHPHIVEVLRHATTDDGALHLVSMPFLGGATLASILDARRQLGRPARSGLDLLADLDRASAPEYPEAELIRPAREILAGLSYPRALAWIVARLAEALDHACARGVGHSDLKPSNILVTAEAVPLLLDMNLATDWRGVKDGEGPAADPGGTLAYMAPERLEAIARGGQGGAADASDGHRADLYALGLVLLEALTGEPPEAPRDRARPIRALAAELAGLREVLPSTLLESRSRPIPRALRAILARCLAPDPARRYARGNELAEDLDLWRSDRPLAFAEEPRRSALARQARRRRQALIGVGLTLTAALLVGSFASMKLKGSRRDEALARYAMVVDRADSGAFGFHRPGHWRDEVLEDPAELSSRHLARYDALADPDWRDRSDVRSLPDRERAELEAWLLEQTLRHAVALGQRVQSPESWTRGLDLLDRTLARTPSATLQGERATLLGLLDRPDRGPGPPAGPSHPAPAWMEGYLAGVAAEPLHARVALDHYLATLRAHPGLFWAHYRATVTAFRIGEYEVAIEQLRQIIARSPNNPAFRLMIASALCHAEWDKSRHEARRSLDEALAECDRAVELAPDYPMAYETRAWVRHALGQAEAAQADIVRHTQLTTRSRPASALNLGFSLNFHPGLNDPRPREDVQSLARRILEGEPRDHGTRTSLGAMIAQADRPAEAIVEFDKVLESHPGHLLARYHRALQIHRSDPAKALEEYSALIDHPRFEELFPEQQDVIRAFHYVAANLLDRGKLAEALGVTHRALAHVNRARWLQDDTTFHSDPFGNRVGFSPAGESYYLLARIHAAEVAEGRDRIGLVVDYLDRAFAVAPGFRDWLAKDRRFERLRDELSRRLPAVVINR